MTPGVPGAGIGGLFYLASTLLLPFRSVARRLRGQSDSLTAGQTAHSLAVAGGVVAGLWATGWILAAIVPETMLSAVGSASIGPIRTRTVLPAATFATAVATLVCVLAAVEIARYAQARRDARDRPREARWT